MSTPQEQGTGTVVPFTQPTNGGGRNGGNYGERLAAIEATVKSIREHGATKTDIANVKIWFLCGVLGAIALAIPVAVGVAFAVARWVTG